MFTYTKFLVEIWLKEWYKEYICLLLRNKIKLHVYGATNVRGVLKMLSGHVFEAWCKEIKNFFLLTKCD